MKTQQLFTNRVCVIGTMHHKERVIVPVLQQELGIKCIVPENFNTDIFGTFTREVERPGTQIAAARLKAQQALEVTGETLVIASEGSFTLHPSFPWIYVNREIVIFIDKQNQIEIIGEELSLETNFNYQVVKNMEEVNNFAIKVGFPEHGLIIKCGDKIIKGINTEENLLKAVNYALQHSHNNQIHIETDMRALYNPTRMRNIAKATHDLLNKINTPCPECSIPGFAIAEKIKGLPCQLCHLPTPSICAVIYQCHKCGFTQEKSSPDGREFAEPSECVNCNP